MVGVAVVTAQAFVNAKRACERAVAAPRARAVVMLLATLAGVALAARLGVWQLDRAAPEDRAADEPRGARARARARRRRRWRASPARRRGTAPSPRRAARPLARRAHGLPRQPPDGRQGRLLRRHAAGARCPARAPCSSSAAGRRATSPPAPQLPALDDARRASSRSTASSPRRRRGCSSSTGAASGPIRQNLDIASFARETGLDLLPLSVLQLDAPGATADGLLRHWPAPAADVQKHYGYAFQWFALAAGIAFLYVWHRFIRPAQP